MQPKTASALAISAALAGAGIGRATVPEQPKPPAPVLQRVCVEADGSAQVEVDDQGRHVQLLVPKDHALAVQTRDGRKVADKVPAGLDAAIKSVSSEAGKLAAIAGAK
jgi:hypothetical protein